MQNHDLTTAFTVDPWDPGYTAALNAEALAELDATSAQLDLDVELPAARWRPVTPDPGTAPPGVLLIADGVRRIDARLWTYGANGEEPTPGLAASCAAGIVRCTPGAADRNGAGTAGPGGAAGAGAPAVLAAVEVSRSVFSASPHLADIRTATARYRARRAADSGMDELVLALQRHLTQLEVDLAISHRAEAEEDDLLLVDGPLRGRTHLPRTVGYIKTHHTAYLPAAQAATVSDLRPGQRTPIFLMGTSWRRHAWYARLPSGSDMPWAGVVRCEANADLALDHLVRLADSVTRALPSLAGVDYKDPRAPQNLVPIGGLERLLRHRLGDARLLYRALRTAAARHGRAPELTSQAT